MSPSHARRLFAFNGWANRRVLEAVRAVSPEDLHRDLRTSFGSIHGTLLHLVAGEWRWLQFWLDRPYEREYLPEEFPDAAAIERFWTEIATEQQAFAEALTEESMRTTKLVRGAQRPLADTLQHLLNHSSYHRGQVASLLRQTGYDPPAIDFLIFAVSE